MRKEEDSTFMQDIKMEVIHTFRDDPATNKWESEFGTCPNKTKVKGQMKTRHADSSLD